MEKSEEPSADVRLAFLSNNFIRGIVKRFYFALVRRHNRWRHIECGRYVDFGYRFRFSRKAPFRAVIGDNVFIEEFNVWNAKNGDIKVGSRCLFGLHDIVMGPAEIGDDFSAGPHVSILGPRHAVFGYELAPEKLTVVGNNVWVSTGAIIFSGVRVGDNAVIGPGSVVTKDVPEDAFMLGNPARDMSKAFQFARPAAKSH